MEIYEKDDKIIVEMPLKRKEYKATKKTRDLFRKFQNIVLFWKSDREFATYTSNIVYFTGFHSVPKNFTKDYFEGTVKSIYNKLNGWGFTDELIEMMTRRLSGKMIKNFDKGYVTIDEYKNHAEAGDVIIFENYKRAFIKTASGYVILNTEDITKYPVVETTYKTTGKVYAEYIGRDGLFGFTDIERDNFIVRTPYFVSADLEIITAYFDGKNLYRIVNGKKEKYPFNIKVFREGDPRPGEFDDMTITVDFWSHEVKWEIGNTIIRYNGEKYSTMGSNFTKTTDMFPYEVTEFGVVV